MPFAEVALPPGALSRRGTGPPEPFSGVRGGRAPLCSAAVLQSTLTGLPGGSGPRLAAGRILTGFSVYGIEKGILSSGRTIAVYFIVGPRKRAWGSPGSCSFFEK